MNTVRWPTEDRLTFFEQRPCRIVFEHCDLKLDHLLISHLMKEGPLRSPNVDMIQQQDQCITMTVFHFILGTTALLHRSLCEVL